MATIIIISIDELFSQIEENHRHKLSALNIMKTEMSTEKRNPIPTNMSGSMQENGKFSRQVYKVPSSIVPRHIPN